MKRNVKSFVPAIVLMVFAPLIAEVLPGATRFSSIFVFPVEMCVWGGGALLIRYAVRRWELGWVNMLLLALALSVAEEFLIQQTSVAPMVIKIKGVTYARAFDINYVYLLWALIYESVFVIFLPVYLVELIFPAHRRDPWLRKGGIIAVVILFLTGSYLAWYSWTQIARPKVFHVAAYNPSAVLIFIAFAGITGLIFLALGPFKNKLRPLPRPLAVPASWVLAVVGALWAVILYGIVALAFGLEPSVSPAIPVCTGLILAAAALYLLPRWTINPDWQERHCYAVIFGTISGAMAAGFIGFIGAASADLYFKLLVNILALILFILFGFSLKKRTVPAIL